MGKVKKGWVTILEPIEDAQQQRFGDGGLILTSIANDVLPQTTSAPTKVRERYFRRLSIDRRQAGMGMAARIKTYMDRRNLSTMRLSAIKRALHGDRHPEAWRDAVSQLRRYQLASVREGWITLTGSDDSLLPDAYPSAGEPKGCKRTRGQSEWFEKNRSKMDNAQHSNFDEDWAEGEDSDERLGLPAFGEVLAGLPEH